VKPSEDEGRQLRVALTRRAALFGVLTVGALLISAVNIIALIHALWHPMGALAMPLYLLFAVTGLLAAVNFRRTRRRALEYRDHPERFLQE
jgi:type IV secretory pathway VirB3-like protein